VASPVRSVLLSSPRCRLLPTDAERVFQALPGAGDEAVEDIEIVKRNRDMVSPAYEPRHQRRIV